MLEPILVEDSTCTKLVPSLEGILGDLNETSTHHDYIVALIIVLLAESGFYLIPNNNHLQRPKLRSLHIPNNWKSQETGIYELYFQLESIPDVICKLVAIPLGDTLILNFFPLMDEKTTYTMSVRTLKYVNPFSSDLCWRYMNLKSISHRFKDALSTPVRSDVLLTAGRMGPSLQSLPTELKLKVFKLLDGLSLTRIAQCCSEFNKLCLEPQLTKHINKDMHKDFPRFVRKARTRLYLK